MNIFLGFWKSSDPGGGCVYKYTGVGRGVGVQLTGVIIIRGKPNIQRGCIYVCTQHKGQDLGGYIYVRARVPLCTVCCE